MVPGLNYHLLSEALDYYGGLGYQHVETPWLVSKKTALMTTEPSRLLEAEAWGKALVGSAEQGFLQLAVEGQLEEDRLYMSAGPCFRPMDSGRSPIHRGEFFKLELFCLNSTTKRYQDTLFIRAAKDFFKEFTHRIIELESTEDGFDLMINGTEVGSYGNRQHDTLCWSYGTGLALPRFPQACEMK